MSKPRQHDVCCFYIALYTVLLGFTEYTMVHRFITNAPSTRFDMLVVTLAFAPLGALAGVVAFMITGLIITRLIPRRK